MGPALVKVEGLEKSYREGGEGTVVLSGATFEINRGETTSLIGTSGAGKSTLLAIVAGLLLPDSGKVQFAGEEVTAMDETERASLRALRIGVVVQSDNLIPFLTASENVELAVELAGGERPAEKAAGILDELGLAGRSGVLPRRLSGGEAQRVALAVALVNEPELLLADEVTAELDSKNAARVLDLILSASAKRGLTVLIVTHSPESARLTDNLLRVADGKVEVG
ncbi:MAG: ABC transporter ATP-binding protein [Solirubrobacterales bacterium]|nr:ABC transporter ATP-binding protein [Solirubrobacterales bacterium]